MLLIFHRLVVCCYLPLKQARLALPQPIPAGRSDGAAPARQESTSTRQRRTPSVRTQEAGDEEDITAGEAYEVGVGSGALSAGLTEGSSGGRSAELGVREALQHLVIQRHRASSELGSKSMVRRVRG